MGLPREIKLRLGHFDRAREPIDCRVQEIRSVGRVFLVFRYLAQGDECSRREVTVWKYAPQFFGGGTRGFPLLSSRVGLSEIKERFGSCFGSGSWNRAQSSDRFRCFSGTVRSNTAPKLILSGCRCGKLRECIVVSSQRVVKSPGSVETVGASDCFFN